MLMQTYVWPVRKHHFPLAARGRGGQVVPLAHKCKSYFLLDFNERLF